MSEEKVRHDEEKALIMEDLQWRQDYLECVDWLLKGEHKLVKKRLSRNFKDPRVFENYVAGAREAAKQIVSKSYDPELVGKPLIEADLSNWFNMCKDGGIQQRQQKELLTQAAQAQFHGMTDEIAGLARDEAEEREARYKALFPAESEVGTSSDVRNSSGVGTTSDSRTPSGVREPSTAQSSAKDTEPSEDADSETETVAQESKK